MQLETKQLFRIRDSLISEKESFKRLPEKYSLRINLHKTLVVECKEFEKIIEIIENELILRGENIQENDSLFKESITQLLNYDNEFQL